MRKKVKFFAAAMTALLIVFQNFSFASVRGISTMTEKSALKISFTGLKLW